MLVRPTHPTHIPAAPAHLKFAKRVEFQRPASAESCALSDRSTVFFSGPLLGSLDLSHIRWRLGSSRRRVMQGHKTRLNSAAYSSIADWFALNSNELTWIVLVSVGVMAARMLM